MRRKKLLLFVTVLLLAALACQTPDFFDGGPNDHINDENNDQGEDLPVIDPILEPAVSSDPNEPVFVSGTVPFTSPFFLDSASEPFVMLEDQAGFIARDEEFEFPLAGQTIGPVWQIDDETMGFSLALPAVPQGTLVDLDNDGQEDQGVMVFAVAYWSNIWGGPFLEEREGTGWSGAHATTITDPEQDYEITGGHLVIWAPDGHQEFPTGFGADGMLFTEDDPVAPVPPGYSIVNLDADPFEIYKEAHPEFVLIEGSGAVKDYTDMSYEEAFEAMFERVSIEYPFTQDKNVDWDALYAEFAPQVAAASNPNDYYTALHNFTLAIPDTHIGLTFNAEVFYFEAGGSFGLVLAELSDGRVIVTQVLPDTTGRAEGIQPGAEIIEWDGLPVTQALDRVDPFLGPYSTEHVRRQDQLLFLTRYPPDTQVTFTYQNPDERPTETTLTAAVDYESLFATLYYFNLDPVGLPVEAYTLDSGIGYIQITTFSDDYNLMAQNWEYYIQGLIDNEVPALIIDMRTNGGGSGGLARNFAAYFFNEEVTASRHAYWNHTLGEWEYGDHPVVIEPGPLYYDGPIAVLVGPDCVSACEGFAYYLSLNDRATIVGHTPSAGAYGEVGRGQYSLPGDIDMQFPTGRPETPNGDLLIEGTGVVPDIIVPVTFDSVMGLVDTVLEAAEDALLP